MHLADLLAHHARYRPERAAVSFGDRRFDWRGFADEVHRLGHLLRAHGVGHGDRVATVLPNGVELLQLLWACAGIGAVSVPLSPLLATEGVRALLGDAEPKVVLACTQTADVVDRALAQLPAAARCLLTDVPAGERALAQALAGLPGHPPAHAVAPDDPFNIIYTSGTTGAPKGIVHTHRIRAHYATLFANAWRMTPSSVVLHTGAIVFNGAFVTMLPAFLLGSRYVLAARFDAAETLALIEREQVTHTMMVPAQIAALLDCPGFDPARLASLEMLLSLGAPLPLPHKETLERCLPGRLHELYGLTEGFVTILDRDDAVRKRGSVGVPPPFYAMRIVREDGGDAAPGEIGEILGRGPILMSGYYRRPDLTSQTIRDGWLHTGDLGRVDEDGFLYLVDRSKDMINSSGVKIYPSDIEAVMLRHPDVLEAVAFGVPDPRWGEAPWAAVVLRAGRQVDPATLRDWINARVDARYQRLAGLDILGEMPRNVAGKVLRRELRQRRTAPGD